VVSKEFSKPVMVMNTCNPSTQELKQEDQDSAQKKKKKKKSCFQVGMSRRREHRIPQHKLKGDNVGTRARQM
jgi:hypothetical protein